MSEPLDLEVTPELVRQALADDWRERFPSPRAVKGFARDIAAAYLQICEERDRLRDEITDRANVEADLRAQLAEAQAKR